MDYTTDDAFLAFAEQQEKEAARRQANSGGSGQERTFEEIRWCGLERGAMKIVRFFGGVPDSKADNYTARSVRIAWLTGDDGKRFRVVFPDRNEAADHILWRVIGRMNQVEWQQGKKVLPVKEKYPTIYDIVAKNGLSPADKRYMFEKGWEGRQVLIANVIDRADYDWHRENKHTALLSRGITIGKEGQVFAEEGVPLYGFISHLTNLFRYYGSWEKYDVGIERTGVKESPYRVVNAPVHIAEIPASARELVVDGPLTEEELSWERYDLAKLFGYTTNTKIFNRLQGTIAKIDAVLGSNFSKELKDAVEIEQAKWEAEKAADAEAPKAESASKPSAKAAKSGNKIEKMFTDGAPVENPAAPPARPARPQAASTATFDTSAIPHWDDLSSAEKDAIANVELSGGKLTNIIYKDTEATLYGCPTCLIPAPDTFTVCPNCGERFA